MIKTKVRKNLGTGFIVVAFLFLFNPDIAIIDVLPDVIGYCFLILGLSELAEINDKIFEACRYFKNAAICNLVKILLIVVLFGLVTPKEMPGSLLLFSFVMSIFDLIYLIPAYKNLFDGLIYFGERLDGYYILSRKKRKSLIKRNGTRAVKTSRRSVTEKTYIFTIIFVVFKAVSPVLPELTSLFAYDGSTYLNLYDFISLYRFMSIAVVLAIGIAWLVRMISYFSNIRRDNVFMNALTEKYEREVLPQKSYFAKKFARRVIALMTVAAAFTIHLYFDSYNIVPGIISSILFIISAILLRKLSKKFSRWLFFSSVCLGITSTVFEIFRFKFNYEFIPEQILRNASANKAWKVLILLSVLEAVAFSFVIVSALLSGREIAHKYTGYYTTGVGAFDPVKETRKLHSELSRPMIFTAIIGILGVFTSVVYIYGLSFGLEGAWLFGVIFGGFFAVRFYINMTDIKGQINYIHFLGE